MGFLRGFLIHVLNKTSIWFSYMRGWNVAVLVATSVEWALHMMKQAGRLQEVLVIRSPPQSGGRVAATCETGTNDTRQSPDFCTKRLRGGCWHANKQNMVLWLPCQHVGGKNTVCTLPVSSTHDEGRWAGLAQSAAPFIKTGLLQMFQCSPGTGDVVNLCQILDLMVQTARLSFLYAWEAMRFCVAREQPRLILNN